MSSDIYHFSKETFIEIVKETLGPIEERVKALEDSAITKQDITDAVTLGLAAHPCWMNEDDRSMVRDMVQGGRYVKKSILLLLVGAIIYAIGWAALTAKGLK